MGRIFNNKILNDALLLFILRCFFFNPEHKEASFLSVWKLRLIHTDSTVQYYMSNISNDVSLVRK